MAVDLLPRLPVSRWISYQPRRFPAWLIGALGPALVLAGALGVHTLPARAAPAPSARPTDRVGPALVRVPAAPASTVRAAVSAGLVPYREVSGTDGEYLLGGLTRNADGTLPDLGVPVRVVDPDSYGASYYLASMLPPRPTPEWKEFGRVLLDDGTHVLLRTTAADAERLAAAGAELAAIPLAPMALPSEAPAGALPLLTVSPDPTVQGMLAQVTSGAVTTYEQALTGVVAATIEGAPYTIQTRYTYSGTPITKATRYAGERFAAHGLNVEYHTWSGSTYPNVIGEITGQTSPADIYVIGAHLDDMPSGPTAPGADDNASGSTAVLIAADVLTQYDWACTLRFALWTGEEQGLLGSAAYAQRAQTRGETIRGYLNLDMLGYDSSGVGEITLIAKSSVTGSVAMMNLFADVVAAYDIGLVPHKYIDDSLGNFSDNASFWASGYASILAAEGRTYGFTPYYHTTSDTLATLNVDYLTKYVKAALGTFVHLSGCLLNGTPVPTPTPSFTPVAPTPTPTPTRLVSGHLRYYVGDQPIVNATMRLDGPTPATATTNGAGGYTFIDPPDGVTTLTPENAADSTGAVGADDAVYVLQALVGLRVLDARQGLACEVSGDGTLSAYDASLILRKSTGALSAFPVETVCGSEWLFVPVPPPAPNQQLVQPNTAGSACQPGAIVFEPLSGSATDQDFVGLVLGDCTGNWAP